MKKTVLAYGDSLTWGLNPVNRLRYAEPLRWQYVLEQELNGKIQVVEEALCGRTTCYDDNSTVDNRNGAAILPTVLASHQPLDLVIIMLGTNDLKPFIAGSAIAATFGIKRLIEIIRSYPFVAGQDQSETIPEILIVSPPHLVETYDPVGAEIFRNWLNESKKLSMFYSNLADQFECAFFDAALVASASPIDGVHLDENNTKAIGKELAPLVRTVLGL